MDVLKGCVRPRLMPFIVLLDLQSEDKNNSVEAGIRKPQQRVITLANHLLILKP